MENKQHSVSCLQQVNALISNSDQPLTTTETPTFTGGKIHSVENGQRIEYIDALRGFTMILVVVTHISNFCLHSYQLSYSSIMAQFRMPLFFFISGFVFYRFIVWDKQSLMAFMRKKIIVQIITPTIFLVLYLYLNNIPIKEILFSKFGYWFTYVLFIYFIFYFCVKLIGQWLQINSKSLNIIFLCWGMVCYFFVPIWGIPFDEDVAKMLLMYNWNYFLFFVLGILAKKYFLRFQQFINNKYFLLYAIVFYFLLNIYSEYIIGIVDVVVGCMRSLCGICVVFAFFQKYSSTFSKSCWLGKGLQYIGRRTLDVYLLHYFFLPIGLTSVFTLFAKNYLPTLEIFVSLFIALLVIILCLIISNVYRLSPWIEQNMFGVKKKE